MSKEDAYKKHLDFMRTVTAWDDVTNYKVEEQYPLLFDFLPNDGKLYKYRSLQGKSFSHTYDALKNGYLWIPTADTLNDDFDSIILGDPFNQYRVLIDYICKDEDKLLYFLTKKFGKEKLEQTKLLSKIPFSNYLRCFDSKTHRWNFENFIDVNFVQSDDKLIAIDEIRSITKELISLMPRPENFVTWAFERNKEAYKMFHVFSLSENYDLDNMWGYYADSGKGFCIEYDFNRGCHLSIDLKKFLLNIYRVNYSGERSFFDIESFWEKFFFENDSDEYMMRITQSMIKQITSKAKCWEHECEWRFVLGSCDSKIYADIVSGIIIDERALSTTNARKLICLCKRNKWELKIRLRRIVDGEHLYIPYDKYLQNKESKND